MSGSKTPVARETAVVTRPPGPSRPVDCAPVPWVTSRATPVDGVNLGHRIIRRGKRSANALTTNVAGGDTPGRIRAVMNGAVEAVRVAEPVRVRRLSNQEGQRLQRLVRRGTGSVARLHRAMVVVASAGGNTVLAIARLVQADEDSVRPTRASPCPRRPRRSSAGHRQPRQSEHAAPRPVRSAGTAALHGKDAPVGDGPTPGARAAAVPARVPRRGIVAHPWPQPLPASWNGQLDRPEPQRYVQVKPTAVA
ncbi:hypothetical protein SAMN04489832_0895 [Micromonospora cremea]|uniref:Transposase n=1 Tax=Micromonospora cremea TaxID=709881 RepID=A0A1N5UG72_9ACTN|nr:hypothetical protein SAMN04489832_0895 [Micromonospora cremea]